MYGCGDVADGRLAWMMASSCSVPRRSAFTRALYVAESATSAGTLRHTCRHSTNLSRERGCKAPMTQRHDQGFERSQRRARLSPRQQRLDGHLEVFPVSRHSGSVDGGPADALHDQNPLAALRACPRSILRRYMSCGHATAVRRRGWPRSGLTRRTRTCGDAYTMGHRRTRRTIGAALCMAGHHLRDPRQLPHARYRAAAV